MFGFFIYWSSLGGRTISSEIYSDVQQVTGEFMQCLADSGVVIYGSVTCPACARLASEYGGYQNMAPIYVECTEDPERCLAEMQVDYVPAVLINGEVFSGWGSPEVLSQATGCPL